MRLASADFSWPGLTPDFVLDLLAELGVDGVSLAFFGGLTERTPQSIGADPDRHAHALLEDLTSRGLTAADVFFVPSADLVGGTVNHPEAAERASGDELFATFARFAERLGVSGITMLPGLVFNGEPWEAALARSSAGLERRLDVARSHGLRLSVEPHILSTTPYAGSVVDTPQKVAALLERVPGLELTLDYGHFNVQGIPDRDVEPLLASARHFHMRGGAPGLVQTRFEDNVTDFGRVLDVMAAVDYDGWVEIEYVYDARPGCTNCDNLQEIRKFREFVRSHEQQAGR